MVIISQSHIYVHSFLGDYARKILLHQEVEKGKWKVQHKSSVGTHHCICKVVLRSSSNAFLWQILYNIALTFQLHDAKNMFMCNHFFNHAFLKRVTA